VFPGNLRFVSGISNLSQTLSDRRVAYQRDLDAALGSIVADLSARPKVHKIILFGSYAEGRRDLFTDLDIVVVMDSELDFVSRTAQLYSQLRTGVDMDLLVYTPQEFERLSQGGFLRHALLNGKIIYEKE
jgi:predicted nucleotidyltransferase